MKFKLFYTLFIAFFCSSALADFSAKDWQRAKVEGLDKIQIKPADIEPHLRQLADYDWLSSNVVGQSFEGRNIHLITVGQGSIKVFMWSQMHGNESTATAALFDFIKFIDQQPGWFDEWKDKITLYLMPMVNPDGAQASKRYNAQDIDINRDAVRLQTPEGRLLMDTAIKIQPDFGFNLHDQNRYYAVGDSDKPATISVLAPAFNVAKDINLKRKQAMQLIGQLVFDASLGLDGYVGRYNDTFEPRAFGDNFSKMGIRTILIESGAYPDDPNRQMPRQANLKMYVHAINRIAKSQYQAADETKYNQIPFNRSNGFVDLKISNLSVKNGNDNYITDITIKTLRNFKGGRVVEVGDTSTTNAFEVLNAKGWHYVGCKRIDAAKQPKELTYTKYMALLKQNLCLFDRNQELTNSSGLPVFFSDTANDDKPLRNMPAAFVIENTQQQQKVILGSQIIDI